MCFLLLSAATAYDEQNQSSRRPSKRHVYNHELDFLDDQGVDPYWADDTDYDIDYPVAVIQANAHERMRNQHPGLSRGRDGSNQVT